MAVRVRRLLTLIAVLALAAVLAPLGIASLAPAMRPLVPTLYVVYTMNCTFSIVDDFGKPVTSIAPGYLPGRGQHADHVQARPARAASASTTSRRTTSPGCKGWVQFQLTGPGVNLFTTLDCGCDAFLLLPAADLQGRLDLHRTDLNQPRSHRTTLHDTGNRVAHVPKSPYANDLGQGHIQQDLVGVGVAERGARARSTAP